MVKSSLCAPTVPNAIPTSHWESAQPRSESLHHLGRGVGGEVEVVAEPAEQRVTDAATHQGELMPGASKRSPSSSATGATRRSSRTAWCCTSESRSGRARTASSIGGMGSV